MKNFTFLAIFLFGLSVISTAQEKRQNQIDRCGTMKVLEEFLKENPWIQQANQQLAREAADPNSPINRGGPSSRLQAIVTIPIVFHIVLPNPYLVTDADIQAQVDRLNLDYSGLNPDSTNIPAQFQAVRGHSQLRFCLAQRTPTGQPTNGIERRASNTLYTGNNNDPIKGAAGGLVAWDYTKYFNVWVGTGGGLLGYATFPGTSSASQQGVVIDVIGTASNPCYVNPNYNLGRTLTHEAGHYFGLYHIWGDEANCSQAASGNTGDDFRQLSGTCTIPASLVTPNGDTPNQGAETYGCASGVVTDNCATTAPGKMYQNYMDYTDDACMTMFTQKQAERMEWVVANCRSGYLTSDGCIPPATGSSVDASPVYIINPGGTESLPDCSSTTYSSSPCPGPFVPKVRIANNGLNTMNSVTVGYILDANPAVTLVYNTPLASNQTAVITFPTISVTAGGAHTIKYFTSNPNGSPDPVTTNDEATANFTVVLPVATNVTESFEGTTFPPTGWRLFNPDGSTTWARSANNRGAVGTRSAFMDVYNYGTFKATDILASPSIVITGQDSLRVSFYVAHAGYTTAGFGPDTLQMVYSPDCGNTWLPFGNYKKWSNGGTNNLSTSANTGSAYNPGTNLANWRQEIVNIALPLPGNPADIMVGWKSITNYGNNIYVDAINIERFQFPAANRDIGLTAINKPLATECVSNITPSVTLKNYGFEPVTQFKVGYRLDNGSNVMTTFNQTIIAGSSVTVDLPAINAAVGNHSIKIFTADPVTPSGTGDPNFTNDTLVRAFNVPLRVTNVIEGFEGATFVPANWVLSNPNNNITWQKADPPVGKNSENSAFIDNWSTNTAGQVDILRAPAVITTGADSAIISFDVAHKNYPASFDELNVYISTNCGNTYTSVYSKSGPALATAGESEDDFREPTQSQWRHERIALTPAQIATGTLFVQFENVSDWGNNIFIDNINIQPVFKRDIEVRSFTPDVVCSASFAPVVTIYNRGTETVTGVKVSYTINNGAALTATLTGLNLLKNTSATVALPAGTLSSGLNTIKVYSYEPVTASGTGDMYIVNDTIVRSAYFVATVSSNISEGFEGSFAPAGWGVSNPDGAITWQKASTGLFSSGSAYMRNYAYYNYVNGQRDGLYTPIMNYTAADSLKLTFDLSASARNYPGSTTIPMDTLEVFVTKDCGNTFTSVYKKWGIDLQTINTANAPQPIEFVPAGPTLWRKESIDLSAFAQGGPLQVIFRNTNNNQNNIYIDNVNLYTKMLPDRLKAEGVVVMPNPFSTQLSLWYIQPPTDLRYVTISNSVGQVIWKKEYQNVTSNIINIDLGDKTLAAGVYIISMGYTDKSKNKQVKLIKQ